MYNFSLLARAHFFLSDKTIPSTPKLKGIHIGFSEAKAVSMSTSPMLTLTLYLLVSSADIFCKHFGPRSGLKNVRPDLDPICLTLRWYS